MDDINVLNYLSERKRKNTELTAEWTEIESLFKDKLWSELTTKIISLISHPALRNEDCLVQLYRNFISSFQIKIDPSKLVDIVSEVTSFMSAKNQAIEFLENIEDTVKVCDDAVWHCYVLKGQIHLNHFDDFDATKKIIDNLRLALGEAAGLPVYWKMFLLASNYCQRVGDLYNDNYRQLEQKLNRETEKLNDEIISQREAFEQKCNRETQKLNDEIISQREAFEQKFNRETESNNKEFKRLNDEIISQREAFDRKILSVISEIEAKFTTEAVRNFEEVISAQTEVSNLRKLNGRLLMECSQLRNQKNGLEDDKTRLEAKLETIITEQEQQKNEQEQQKKALMLMGAHLEKLSLKEDSDESGPSNETGQL